MKKILAIAMTVAMILSMAAIGASALQPNLTGTPAEYSGGSRDVFETVGDVTIAWVPDAQSKLNLKDGDLADWAELGLEPTVITPNNMVSWNGLHKVPEGFKMTTYFMADKDYLYVGFYIVDPEVVAVPADNPANYGAGDAFQINIDFGRKLGWIVENDPDTTAILGNTQNVFYSFGFNGDDGPVVVQVQCSDNDRVLKEEQGVIGSTGKTADGWCAEFTLPFQEMYNDYIYKAYLDENEDNAVKVDAETPFKLGVGLYCLDSSTTTNDAGESVIAMTWASGTHSGFTGTDANGELLDPATNKPQVRWDVYDNAMTLILNYEEGMEFTCNGILVDGEKFETQAPETQAPETQAPETQAPETQEPKETEEEESENETTADTTADTTGETKAETEAPADTGCASVVGFGAVAVMAAAAAAVVLKKKD